MTVRRLLEAVIKILGIYYAVSAVQQVAFLLALWRAHPPREFNVPLAVIADTPVILSKAIVAAVLLFAGNAVAGWLVGGRHGVEEADRGLPRRELLYIGTCLVGLVFLLMAIPDIGRFAVLGFWYAGASRQAQAGELWNRTTMELLLRSVVGAAAAVSLILGAGPVADWLERRADRETVSPEQDGDS